MLHKQIQSQIQIRIQIYLFSQHLSESAYWKRSVLLELLWVVEEVDLHPNVSILRILNVVPYKQEAIAMTASRFFRHLSCSGDILLDVCTVWDVFI